jgi:hypothetical protein
MSADASTLRCRLDRRWPYSSSRSSARQSTPILLSLPIPMRPF